MKVALVHDYLKEYGGAERVLETLHEVYPDAPIYTTVYLPSYLGPHQKRFSSMNIVTSWAQYLPFKAKLISPLRLLSPLLFRSFDFSSFDVVISSATGAYFPNALDKKKAKLISYCHTPPRYLYGYKTAREWKNNPFLRVIGETMNHFLRMWDYSYSRNVDQYVANSEEIKGRIKKFYRKDAVVIYPPIDLPKGDEKDRNKEAYFVTGGRLARAKNYDLIVKTCLKSSIPLKIFGKGFAGYEEELRSLAKGKETIEFLGEVTDEEKYEVISKAKAFLFAAEDEDFGMTPVEAMACGTPVIAYRSGGVKETVVENKTGLFFDQLDEKSLIESIKEFNKKTWNSTEIRKRAALFSKEHFKKQITPLVSS